jgi:hypothetical protein
MGNLGLGLVLVLTKIRGGYRLPSVLDPCPRSFHIECSHPLIMIDSLYLARHANLVRRVTILELCTRGLCLHLRFSSTFALAASAIKTSVKVGPCGVSDSG